MIIVFVLKKNKKILTYESESLIFYSELQIDCFYDLKFYRNS